LTKAKNVLKSLEMGWTPAGESVRSKKIRYTHFNMADQKGPNALYDIGRQSGKKKRATRKRK